jgi:hypothetical protein
MTKILRKMLTRKLSWDFKIVKTRLLALLLNNTIYNSDDTCVMHILGRFSLPNLKSFKDKKQ